MRGRTEPIGAVSRHIPISPMSIGSRASSVWSRPICPNNAMPANPMPANAVGAAAVVPRPMVRQPDANVRRRSVAESGSGASWPIAGTPSVMSSRPPMIRKATTAAQASKAVRCGPAARVSATLRPTAAAAANLSSEAGRRSTARTCALPRVWRKRTSASGTSRIRSR